MGGANYLVTSGKALTINVVTGSEGQNVNLEIKATLGSLASLPTVHCCLCVSASGWRAPCLRGRGARGGWAPFQKGAADHDRVCRRSLQHFAAIASFDAAAEEGYSWGRGLEPRRVVSGRLPITL